MSVVSVLRLAVKFHILAVLLMLLAPVGLALGGGEGLEVGHLRVDHLLYPELQVKDGYPVAGDEGTFDRRTLIGNKRPVFGWELRGAGTSGSQSAYRIIVSREPGAVEEGRGDVWDSGKVESGESINVVYDGAELDAEAGYFWRVMVWDGEDRHSGWSPVGRFRMDAKLVDYRTSVYPLVKTDDVAAKILRTSDVVRIDFGRASFGQLKMTLSAEDEGGTVAVRLGEAVHPDGRINREPGGTIRFAEYQVALRPGRHSYVLQFRRDKRNTGPQAIKMPEYIGEVYPFRYVEIEGYEGRIEAGDVVRASVHYPFDDSAAHFESSDVVLNAVWELCKYSIKATSFAGIYVDGDRERIPYEADAYINQLSHYGVDGEYSMARRSHEYLIHNATWPTEWILQSVLMAYNDWLYTGDLRSVDFFYDDLKAKLLLALREDNGFISTRTGKQTPEVLRSVHFKGKELRDIVDWPHTGGFGMEGLGETDGFVFTDYNAVVNAFHFKALRDMEELARVLGRDDDAVEFGARAEETYEAFQSLLWDEEAGVYRDGIDTDHAALHTNMMAFAFGLVPADRQESVMEFIRSRGMACSVYGSQFLMDAIYDAGDGEYGLSLLRSESDRSWFNMIRAGSTITMEAWDNKYKPNQDWNHAWGAVPANVIPRKLMGIEPITPGWGEFRVRPQIGSLEHASIRVPTIRGSVELSCRQSGAEQEYRLRFPANMTAHFELPVGAAGAPRVTVNGEAVEARVDGKWLRLPGMGGGEYVVYVYGEDEAR